MTRLIPLALLLTAGCLPASGDQESSANAPVLSPVDATRVEVAHMQPTAARLDLDLPGEIEGARDATLAAALGGYVEAVRVQEGQEVRRGQTLILVDASTHKAGLAQAQAQAELAASELERVRDLGDLASAAQLQGADTRAKVAAAALQQAEVRYARSVISAPFAGVVAQVAVEPGEVAGPGAPVLRLVQLDPVRVSLAVPDRDVVSLSEGMTVQVTTNARPEPVVGTIVRVTPAADTRSRAFPVEVDVDNPDHALLPGMIAQVRATRVVRDAALVLPLEWLVTRIDSQGVYVEEDGVAAWRELQLGPVVRDHVIVDGGLSEEDRVVFVGQRGLLDGDPLLVTREATCCDADGRVVYGEAL